MKVHVIFEERVLVWCSWRVFSGEEGGRGSTAGQACKRRAGWGGLSSLKAQQGSAVS